MPTLRGAGVVAIMCFALALSGCGKEVGRIPLTGEGDGSTSVAVGSKGLALWTDLDVEFTGTMTARYDVEILQGGKAIATVTCDPFDVSTKIKSVETRINGKQAIRYSGKMRCSANVPAGATEVKATLSMARRPTTQTITKMDLVLKE